MRGRDAQPDALAPDLADADGILVRSATKVTAALMDAAPGLRIIARAGTGVDNVDVAAASARGILVVNAPGANSISVAEHACALMLALSRTIPAADSAMKNGKWEKKRFLGTEVRGKTLGIAGLGRIGQEVAQRARAFGMRVVAHDPYISKDIAASLGVELMTLDEVCASADYLTLHLPSTPETKHLFNDDRFARCKPGHSADQHGARRADRRSGAQTRDREGPCRRRGPRRLRNRAAHRLVARPTSAGHRDAAHRGVDRGGAGARRHRDGRHRSRFPA